MEENKMGKHLTIVTARQVGFNLLGILATIIVCSVLMRVVHIADDPEAAGIKKRIARKAKKIS